MRYGGRCEKLELTASDDVWVRWEGDGQHLRYHAVSEPTVYPIDGDKFPQFALSQLYVERPQLPASLRIRLLCRDAVLGWSWEGGRAHRWMEGKRTLWSRPPESLLPEINNGTDAIWRLRSLAFQEGFLVTSNDPMEGRTADRYFRQLPDINDRKDWSVARLDSRKFPDRHEVTSLFESKVPSAARIQLDCVHRLDRQEDRCTIHPLGELPQVIYQYTVTCEKGACNGVESIKLPDGSLLQSDHKGNQSLEDSWLGP
jgi:hypothetical protein